MAEKTKRQMQACSISAPAPAAPGLQRYKTKHAVPNKQTKQQSSRGKVLLLIPYVLCPKNLNCSIGDGLSRMSLNIQIKQK